MYVAYEKSSANKGVFYLPAIGGMMSDRPVLRKKGNVISVGDNREIYEGAHADELYADILSALASGKTRLFDIPPYIAKKDAEAAAVAAAAAAAEEATAETETETETEAPPAEAAAAATEAESAEAESAEAESSGNARGRGRRRSTQTKAPEDPEGSDA